ncbi:hypothetical protein D3C84_462300 [compost metagenome]
MPSSFTKQVLFPYYSGCPCLRKVEVRNPAAHRAARPGQSINISQVAFLLAQLAPIVGGAFQAQSTVALRNLAQGLVDIFGHAAGITTDVQLRTFL